MPSVGSMLPLSKLIGENMAILNETAELVSEFAQNYPTLTAAQAIQHTVYGQKYDFEGGFASVLLMRKMTDGYAHWVHFFKGKNHEQIETPIHAHFSGRKDSNIDEQWTLISGGQVHIYLYDEDGREFDLRVLVQGSSERIPSGICRKIVVIPKPGEIETLLTLWTEKTDGSGGGDSYLPNTPLPVAWQ